jgi:hypothetical protein
MSDKLLACREPFADFCSSISATSWQLVGQLLGIVELTAYVLLVLAPPIVATPLVFELFSRKYWGSFLRP